MIRSMPMLMSKVFILNCQNLLFLWCICLYIWDLFQFFLWGISWYKVCSLWLNIILHIFLIITGCSFLLSMKYNTASCFDCISIQSSIGIWMQIFMTHWFFLTIYYNNLVKILFSQNRKVYFPRSIISIIHEVLIRYRNYRSKKISCFCNTK